MCLASFILLVNISSQIVHWISCWIVSLDFEHLWFLFLSPIREQEVKPHSLQVWIFFTPLLISSCLFILSLSINITSHLEQNWFLGLFLIFSPILVFEHLWFTFLSPIVVQDLNLHSLQVWMFFTLLLISSCLFNLAFSLNLTSHLAHWNFWE